MRRIIESANGSRILTRGCQMVYFQTKNRNLVKFWRYLDWKKLVYSVAIWNICITAIWYILWQFGNLVYFPYLWYIKWRQIWQPWADHSSCKWKPTSDNRSKLSEPCCVRSYYYWQRRFTDFSREKNDGRGCVTGGAGNAGRMARSTVVRKTWFGSNHVSNTLNFVP
jgi:hypothetical protein